MGESAARNRVARDRLLDAVAGGGRSMRGCNVIYAISVPAEGVVCGEVVNGEF